MDFTVASMMAVRQLNTQTEATTRILRKMLDMQQNASMDLVALIGQSAGIGQNINLLA